MAHCPHRAAPANSPAALEGSSPSSPDRAVDASAAQESDRYLEGLPAGHPILANENVFAFGFGAASLEVLQLLLMVAAPGGTANVGAQNYHFKTGTIDLETRDCEARCLYDHEYVGLADDADLAVSGRHRGRRARTSGARGQTGGVAGAGGAQARPAADPTGATT
jgi:hypothetical protein